MKAPTLDRRIHVRRCVSCGFDGDLLQSGTAERCTRCGCDLRERPARSYAEMEGLSGLLTPRGVRCEEEIRRPTLERWLAFCILIGACLLAIAYLAAAMTL